MIDLWSKMGRIGWNWSRSLKENFYFRNSETIGCAESHGDQEQRQQRRWEAHWIHCTSSPLYRYHVSPLRRFPLHRNNSSSSSCPYIFFSNRSVKIARIIRITIDRWKFIINRSETRRSRDDEIFKFRGDVRSLNFTGDQGVCSCNPNNLDEGRYRSLHAWSENSRNVVSIPSRGHVSPRSTTVHPRYVNDIRFLPWLNLFPIPDLDRSIHLSCYEFKNS